MGFPVCPRVNDSDTEGFIVLKGNNNIQRQDSILAKICLIFVALAVASLGIACVFA